MGTMEQLIREHWKSARRIVYAQHRRWHLPAVDREDVFQDTMARLVRRPPDLSKAKDPGELFLAAVHRNARNALLDVQGYHNVGRDGQSRRVQGEVSTMPVGLYQAGNPADVKSILDERILPSMASAEDVYMSSLPSKRQVTLQEAIENLPERQRIALTHQVYDELSVDESAKLMGLTVTQVYQARGEGMRNLKKKLNPKGRQNG
jgi:RNA polymerase sigma factor (sigma-70 family)